MYKLTNFNDIYIKQRLKINYLNNFIQWQKTLNTYHMSKIIQ